jgi:hypothetical protein
MAESSSVLHGVIDWWPSWHTKNMARREIACAAVGLLLTVLPGCEKSGCDCIPEQSQGGNGWGDGPADPTCGENLCPLIVARGGGEISPSEFELDTPDAVECALEALRDRTPGFITYDWDTDFGQYTTSGYILIDADGTAIYRSWGNRDLSFDVGDAVMRELQPVESYAQCLEETDARARLQCVLTSTGTEIETCASGWSYSDY